MNGRPIHVHDRPKWLFPLLAVGCLALGVLFALFGGLVLDGRFVAVDQGLREWTIADQPRAVTRTFEVISTLGSSKYLAIIGGAIGLVLLPRRLWWVPLLILCTLSVGWFINWLKDAYEVKRPLGGLLTQSTHSFPSGHAGGAAAICTFLAYVAVRHKVQPWIFAPIAAIVALLVGLSRIVLDKHWASDVLGGWVVGTAFAAAFAALYDWTLRYHRAETRKSVEPSTPGEIRIPS